MICWAELESVVISPSHRYHYHYCCPRHVHLCALAAAAAALPSAPTDILRFAYLWESGASRSRCPPPSTPCPTLTGRPDVESRQLLLHVHVLTAVRAQSPKLLPGYLPKAWDVHLSHAMCHAYFQVKDFFDVM